MLKTEENKLAFEQKVVTIIFFFSCNHFEVLVRLIKSDKSIELHGNEKHYFNNLCSQISIKSITSNGTMYV